MLHSLLGVLRLEPIRLNHRHETSLIKEDFSRSTCEHAFVDDAISSQEKTVGGELHQPWVCYLVDISRN